MAIKYKILGQAFPAANANATLYTVPVGNSAVISTLNICNLSLSNVVFRIAVVKGGVTPTPSNSYIAFNTALPALDAIGLTLGITMDATDIVQVHSTQGNVSFNLFGSEIY
jgi:hypothetical protein